MSAAVNWMSLAHCCLELGQIYARREENQKAGSELIKAIELYRSLGMTFWLPRVEAIHREVCREVVP